MGLFDIFGGGKDPSKDAMKYLNQVPGTVKPYYDPFIQAGQRQLPGLEEQYAGLISNPGQMLNQIGSGYQQSPGYEFALQQALQGAQHSAAAGGMAGSPMAQQQSMQLANDIASQDYQRYLQNALGLYGTGLSGSQGLYNMGYGASDTLAQLLAGNLGSQASLGYAGGANKNMMNLGTLGALTGGASSFFGGSTKPWIFG